MTLLTMLAAVGTAGYMLIEGWTFTDALFMAVVILSVTIDRPDRRYGAISTGLARPA